MTETQLAEPTLDTLPAPTATTDDSTPTEGALPSPSEAAGAVEAQEQAAWATIGESKYADAYGILDHPDVKLIRERDDGRRDEQARAALNTEFEQKHRDWESTNLHSTVQSQFGRLLQQVADGDVEAFDKQITKLEGLIGPYTDDFKAVEYQRGVNAAVGDFKRLFSTGLDRRSADELEDGMKRGDFKQWQDLFDFREKAKIERAVSPLKAKLAEAEAEIERLKVGARDGKGPPLGGGTTGGGKPYSQMTRDERAALSPAERDRLTAQEIGA